MGTSKNVRALGVVLAASSALVLGVGVFSTDGEAASPATTTMGVKLKIDAQCKVTVNGDLVFPDSTLIETNLTASTSFTVRCTKGAEYAVSVLKGLHYDSDTKSRNMSNGTDRIAYSLYTTSGLGTAWDPAGSTEKVFKNTNSYEVHGLVEASANDYSPGQYQDTVQIQVDY